MHKTISPGILKRDNNLWSETVYPGQELLIRVRDDEENSESSTTAEKKDSEAASTDVETSNIQENNIQPQFQEEVKEVSPTKSENEKQEEPNNWTVYYCTSVGDIEGNLSFDGFRLIFKPKELKTLEFDHPEDDRKPVSKSEYERRFLPQWGAEINIKDISVCHVMVVPSTKVEDHFEMNHEYEMDYVMQIILLDHGSRSMGKYLNNLFSAMKEKRTPYACVLFKIKTEIDETREYSNKQKHKMSHQIQEKIMKLKKDLDSKNQVQENTEEVEKENKEEKKLQEKNQEEKKSEEDNKEDEIQKETSLPYFEFIFDNFERQDADVLKKISRKETLSLLQEIEVEKAKSGVEIKQIETRPRGFTKKKITPKIVGESQILNLEQFTELLNCVPHLYQTIEWRMIYSNIADGTSYNNLLRRAEHESPLLVIIKDEHDFVFGAYCNSELWFSEDYYGNGETFLYTFRDLNEITPFYWSKKNSLFLYVNEIGIYFGAQPHYGLWINNELTKGRSFESETFDNKLLSYKTDFEVMKIEVWGVIDPFKKPVVEEKINYSEMRS